MGSYHGNLDVVLNVKQCIFYDLRALSDDFGSLDGRGGGIRTPDPLVPNQMRYQTALRPDSF